MTAAVPSIASPCEVCLRRPSAGDIALRCVVEEESRPRVRQWRACGTCLDMARPVIGRLVFEMAARNSHVSVATFAAYMRRAMAKAQRRRR